MQIADGLHRLGSGMINAYLVADGGRVTIVPGHTPGSAVLHGAKLDALFVGDGFATYAVTTGVIGPQIAPFTADAAQALASLDRIVGIEAHWLLPGHGQPWTGGAAAAV